MRGAVLLLVLALRTTAFNLDTAHSLVWSMQSPNFGYKLNISRSHDDEYSLFVAAPREIPVHPGNLCLAGACFQCPVLENPNCTRTETDFPEKTLEASSAFSVKGAWSYQLKPQQKGFQVIISGSIHHNQSILRDEGELPGHIYDRTWYQADLNGDDSEDLVLGSPLEPHSEGGLVYVYISQKDDPIKQVQTIEGKKLKGALFGKCVSSIGDINNDKFQDIAVGAPGEDGGRGAIYIYHGSREGIDRLYSQRISAGDVYRAGTLGIRGFGIFIFGGVDVDNNGYPDVAVGASDSEHVVLLKARPVIHLRVNLILNIKWISNITEEKFTVSYTISFTSTDRETQIEVEVWMRADPLVCVVEAYSSCARSGGELYRKTIALSANRTEHDTITVALVRGVTISPEPIPVELHYRQVEHSTKDFCKTCPVIDPSDPGVTMLRINHSLSCGDHVCRTKLRFHAHLVDKTIQESTEKLLRVKISASVESLVEPAFLATIILEAPFHFPVTSKSYCRDRSTSSRMRLECDAGNPLTSMDGPNILFLELYVRDVPATTDPFQINISATCAGEDDNKADNFVIITLREGSSEPKWILAVSIVGGIIACALLAAGVTAVFKCRKFRRKILEDNCNTEEYHEYCELEYAVPDIIEKTYSRENEFYQSAVATNTHP